MRNARDEGQEDGRVQALEERVDALAAAVQGLQARASSGDRLRALNYERRADPVIIGGGAQLRAARKRVGWSQPQLAAALSVQKQSVSRWESDQTAIVRWRAQQIADVFTRSEQQPPAWPLEGWTLPIDLYMTDDD
jgi:DNA-binding transcriptional regulator YiaG